MTLSWIIPCYNSEAFIEKTVREVEEYLHARGFDHEVIVVDNASTDGTSAVVKRLASELPHVKLLFQGVKGKGAAVRKGMLEASGDIRLFSDADNSTPPNSFDAMHQQFKKGYDVVISSRDEKDAKGAGRSVKEPLYRELLGKGGNLAIQILGVWGIWDTQNGFKALTAKAAETIFKKMKIDGFAFDVEMLALAKRHSYRIGIIPVVWKYEEHSTVTLSSYPKFFGDIIKMRWNVLTGAYD